jgi:hypothetical protein
VSSPIEMRRTTRKCQAERLYRSAPASGRLVSHRRLWLPAYTHADGASATPQFRDDGSHVYALDDHDAAPWYVLKDASTRVAGHPSGTGQGAWFEVLGSFVYPTPSHPAGCSASCPAYRLSEP